MSPRRHHKTHVPDESWMDLLNSARRARGLGPLTGRGRRLLSKSPGWYRAVVSYYGNVVYK